MEKRDCLGNEELNRTAGEQLAKRRMELGWSQSMLSRKSGVSKTQISRIENNHACPGYDVIDKLEGALGVPLMDLFREQRRKQRHKPDVGESDPNQLITEFERRLAQMKPSDEDMKRIFNGVLRELDKKLQENQQK